MLIISKTEQLDTLFDEWEQSMPEYNGKFMKDGIINEKEFENTKHKILFITKEPNRPNQEAGDFRVWWKDEVKYTFSYRLAEWSYGLLNNLPIFSEINTESRNSSIRKIAFMNIKKSGGGGKSRKHD